MITNLMKRALSLLLSLALLLSNVPAVAFATEEETVTATEAAAVEETVAAAETSEPAATEAAEETATPTQPAVPEETAAPTVAETEVPEETAAPTESATESLEETVAPIDAEIEGTIPGEYALTSTSGDVVASGTCGDDLNWTLDTEGALTISGTGAMDAFSSAADAPWYTSRAQITAVQIADGVTGISSYAFTECTGLTTIYIPSSVTTITTSSTRSSPFYGCSSELQIYCAAQTKPDGWGSYWKYYASSSYLDVFYGFTRADYSFWTTVDKSAETIIIPEGVTRIMEDAFSGCTNLTGVTIPDTVTTIGSCAFKMCTGLRQIYIPESVTTISASTSYSSASYIYSPFYGCSSGLVIYCGAKEAQSGWESYWNYYSSTKKLTVCYDQLASEYAFWASVPTGATTLEIPEGITRIPEQALANYTSLQRVVISDSVISIGTKAFYKCTGLKELVFPQKLEHIGAEAFYGCSSLTEIVIPDSVTSMGDDVFWNCSGLVNVKLGRGLTEIPDATFYKCTNLTSLDIPANITRIGTNAFQSCTGLSAIYIPSTVTGMPSTSNACAFYDCDESLAIYCGHEAAPSDWGSWNGDLTVNYGYSKSEYDYWTSFYKTTSSVQISDGITQIPNKAFYNFTNLENVYIPDSVTAIGSNAFSGCTSLKNLYIPAAVSVISAEEYDSAPFYDCDDSLQVYFGAAQEQESWDYYWDCYASSTYHITKHFGYTRAEYDYWMSVDKTVSSLTIPEGITKIPDYFFRGREYIRDTPLSGSNTTLRSVTIPSSVTTIGEYAFEYCKALTKVTLADGVECIGEGAFLGCTGLNNISIPASVKLVDYYAFDECENLVIRYAGTMLEWADVSESRLKAVCSDGTIVDYGSCGIGVSWLMDNKYTLTIFGDGAMTNYDYYWKVPWYAYTDYITSVKILDGVNSIGTRAFYGCKKLTSVSIPETVVNIEAYSFSECTALKTITIPRSVNYIGVEAFYNNKALSTITFRHGINDELTIDLGAFVTFNKTKKTTVRVPNKTEINLSIESYDWSGDLRKVTYKSHNCDGKHYIVSVNAVEATCTQDGSTGKCYCEVCGTVLNEDTVVPALGHDVDLWETGKEATYTVAGERHGNCTRCGEFVSEIIPALGLPEPVVQVVSDPATGGGILSWEDDGEADCYEVYRATSKKGKYTLLTSVEETEVNVSVSVGKTYYYKVKAICDADASLSSGYSAVVKVTGKCAQPEIVVEANAASGKPVLGWEKISGAKKYEVYRATAEDGTYKKVKTVTTQSFTDTSATVGTTYFYKVKAVASKSTYNSVYSEVQPCLTICAQPSVTLKITAATGKPALSWKAISGAVAYEIYRAESADGEFAKLATQPELTYTDISAEPDKDYWYKVNAIGASEDLNSVDGTAKMIHATLAKPVVTFQVDSISGKPVLTWEPVAGAVEYKIYRSTSATKSYKEVNATDGLKYTDTSAGVGKGYYYKVIAIGENCKSVYSDYKKLTAKCAQPEIAVEANAASGKPVLSWEKISGAKKYEVYRATVADGAYKKVKTTTSRSYTDTAAAVGTTYFYKVKAVASKSSYNSTYSEIKSCLTVCAQPSVTLKTVAATGKPTLSWKAVTGAVGYEIYRAENDGDYALIATQAELSYTDENTAVDGKYSYKVNAVAENTALNSADGNPVTITAACAQPVVSIALNGKKPMISWETVEGAVKYEVYRSIKKSSGYKKVATVEEGESYTDSKAKKGTTYYYKVVAVSENASSAQSAYVKIKSK